MTDSFRIPEQPDTKGISPHEAEEFLLLVQHFPEPFRAHMIQRYAEHIVDRHVTEEDWDNWLDGFEIEPVEMPLE